MSEQAVIEAVSPVMAFLMPERTTLLVGVEDLPDGRTFAYLGARHLNVGVIVDGDDNRAAVHRAWNSGGHVFLTKPPDDALFHRDDV